MNRETPRWLLRYADYKTSLANLQIAGDLHSQKPLNIVEQAGMIQLFELSWELGWKLLRERLEALDFTQGITSPAGAVRTAFGQGLIADGQGWIDAAKLRNTLSHEYKPDRAVEALTHIAERFLPLFQDLEAKLANDYIAQSDAERS